MIPEDGYFLFRFDTVSHAEKIKREIQKRKFYATLPRKLDVAVEEAAKQMEQNETKDERSVRFSETLEGSTALGGEMRLSADWVINDDSA